jgi:hypothetical protein
MYIVSHEKFGKLVQPGNICDIVALEYRHLTEPERVKNKTIIRSVYRTIDLLFDFVLLFLFIAVSLLFIGLCHFIKFSHGSSHKFSFLRPDRNIWDFMVSIQTCRWGFIQIRITYERTFLRFKIWW